jgi:diguanylate cyclase (GGDEF)-like protein
MLLMSEKEPRRPEARDASPRVANDPRHLNAGRLRSCGDPQFPLPEPERRDFEELIDTVRSSLWGLLETPSEGPVAEITCGMETPLRSTAREGAAALERLQSNLIQAFETREQLEREIRDAREALERMRAELAGTQAGERQARHLAAHDPLTGLANRAHFHERLCHALALHALSGRGMAVLYIDLDGFKPINDTYGHAAGDTLLRIVASRLSHGVRAGDLVSRLGGDEFACLLQEVDSGEHARHLAMKLLESLKAPCKVGEHLVQVTASIGITFDVEGNGNASDLLLTADMAMYRAKREGCGVAIYEA